MKSASSGVVRLFLKMVSSKYFFVAVLLMFALQGLWYALSFAPSIYDEGVHLGMVYFFAENINPFFLQQDVKWDYLGEATRGSSYLFLYLLSIPLHIIFQITPSETLQVVGLRLLMIPLFLAALYFMRAALLRSGVSAIVVNMSVLMFALIPIFSVMPGVVTYDTPLFFTFALMIYFCSNIITSRSIRFGDIAAIYILAMLSLVIKGSSALALILPIFIYMTIHIAVKYKGREFLRGLRLSFMRIKLPARVLLVTLLVVSTVLVIERPVANAIKYQSFNAPCVEVKSVERCNKNFTARSNQKLADTKAVDFKPANPYEYILTLWVPSLVNTMMRPLATPAPFPLIQLALFSSLFIGAIFVLVYARSLFRNKLLQLLGCVALVYLAALFVSNYSAYIKIGQPVAMSGRYLLYIVPIFAVFVGESIRLFVKNKLTAIFSSMFVAALLMLMIQGGGITTYLLTYHVYWNERSELVNQSAAELVSPAILETTPFRTF